MFIKKLVFSLKSPMNLSYWWNLGSLLGLMIVVQILSGFMLTFYYENSPYSFNSLWMIHLDMVKGYLLHYIHLNMASYVFMIMYLHIIKGLLYNSFSQLKYLWISGWVLMMIMMMIAFMGYVLPWGQMSLWGATVITNLISAFPIVGISLVEWVWGGYFVSNFTMKLFFSLHFLIPFILLIMILMHLFILHLFGSSSPLGGFNMLMKEEFDLIYIWKDAVNILILMIMMILSLFFPYVFGDPENFIKASPMISPIHIQPEWYFLHYYAILRSIPNKLGAVIFFIMALMMVLSLGLLSAKFQVQSTNSWFLSVNIFVVVNMMLMWLGGCPVEAPFLLLSKIFTIMYFINPVMLFFLVK
uniref:Cytochrome b n=1 Tax=Thaumamermis cosgrovei TaxID=382538 RepID=Q1HBD7_THACS|nr:cytochrome b [Thaumamermis cosgrovei]ABF48145.1 cytochrome b [Thaumamermis cosgrovei]ABF48157.1 cytochrome b [Thaumamermis cosgrovei]